MEIKERCALAASQYIKEGMIIGLGGGSTIAYLVALIKESKKNIQVVTPSFTTAKLCIENQIPVLPTWSIDHLDLAFDGCDEVDLDLNALKSGGGIHTQEKIIASMAEDYILLVDESKVFDHLPFHHSLTLEVIPESLSYVIKEVKALGAEVKMRTSQAKDGVTISDNGNYILEASFKEVRNCATLNQLLSGITGLVDTSLFVDKVSFAIVADESSTRIIK